MTNEQTREQFVLALNSNAYIGMCTCDDMINAINALEKQIPKKPLVWENKYYYSPTPNDDWGYECPYCGSQDIDYPEHHCTCGQALDWEPDVIEHVVNKTFAMIDEDSFLIM